MSNFHSMKCTQSGPKTESFLISRVTEAYQNTLCSEHRCFEGLISNCQSVYIAFEVARNRNFTVINCYLL